MFCPIVKPAALRLGHEKFPDQLVDYDYRRRRHGRGDSRHDPGGEPPILGIAAFALFMALINASIKPIVHLIALPFAILSLGLVTLIINWLFMRLASWLAVSLFGVGVFVHGFRWSVLGSLVLTIVAGIVGSILDQ